MKMILLLRTIGLATLITLLSCNNKAANDGSDGVPVPSAGATTQAPPSMAVASERIDLSNKGVGPITSVTLTEIDPALVTQGQTVFNTMCTACHKPDKRFIGPAPKGVLDRRSPEWVMNMILNPENMLENDPLAKDLLIEFNGAPMANQNLTEQDARAVLEYFRTL